jgi:tetratricopeptide (TPR) repeat protein
MARALGELGRFDEAVAVGDEALMLAENAKHAFSFVFAAVTLGVVLIRKGDFERSVPTLERALERGQRTHCELLMPFCSATLGLVYVRTGRTAAGRDLLEQADRYVLGAGWEQWPITANCLAEGSLALGDPAAAAARAARTIEAARADTVLGELARAQFILAEAISRQDPGDPRAGRLYEAALEQADRLAMAPLAARVHLALARRCRCDGRQRKGVEHQRLAAALIDSLGLIEAALPVEIEA